MRDRAVSLGSPGGHLITNDSYENYRLEVEYRFAAKPGNCGVLVHASTRNAYLREHLSEVLKTISCRLFPGPAFELHLIKKTPDEIRAILAAEVIRAAMRSRLEDFERFAARI